MVWFPPEFCTTPKLQQKVILSEYGMGESSGPAWVPEEGADPFLGTEAQWHCCPHHQHCQNYRNHYRTSPALEHIRQPCRQSWQQSPLVTLAECSHPCFADERNKFTTGWSCACTIQVRPAAAVAFCLVTLWTFRSSQRWMAGSISPLFPPQHWNSTQPEKASALPRARVIPLGTLQVLSSH